jgi:hypothetical protein
MKNDLGNDLGIKDLFLLIGTIIYAVVLVWWEVF